MSDNKKAEKNKKINKMTLVEIDKAIESTKQNQGGLTSKYGQELIKRREILSSKK